MTTETVSPALTTTDTPESPAPSLQDTLDSVRRELETSRSLLEQTKLERELQRAAFDAGAIDLDAVTALAARPTGAPAQADPRAAIDELKKTKPHLFRPRTAVAPNAAAATAAPRTTAMAANAPQDPQAPLAAAARRAAAGDRNALLHYLRLKRLATS